MPAKSAASPLRPIIVRAASAADRTGSLATSLVSGVATKPGATALQHTPLGAQASDCDRVSPVSPALAAPYPPLLPNARIACCEAMLTIRPQPRPAMPGPKALRELERRGEVHGHELVPVGQGQPS